MKKGNLITKSRMGKKKKKCFGKKLIWYPIEKYLHQVQRIMT